MANGKNLTDLMDRFLPRFVICALSLLILTQIVLFIDETRHFVSRTDQLEGEQLAQNRPGNFKEAPVRTVLEPFQKLRRGKSLSITVLTEEKRPNVNVRVNGQLAGTFRDGAVQLTVYENDYLEIDASEWPELVRYRIEGDAGLLLPINGVELETKGDSSAIGRVKLK